MRAWCRGEGPPSDHVPVPLPRMAIAMPPELIRLPPIAYLEALVLHVGAPASLHRRGEPKAVQPVPPVRTEPELRL